MRTLEKLKNGAIHKEITLFEEGKLTYFFKSVTIFMEDYELWVTDGVEIKDGINNTFLKWSPNPPE